MTDVDVAWGKPRLYHCFRLSAHPDEENHLASRSSLARHPLGAGGDSRDPPPRDENPTKRTRCPCGDEDSFESQAVVDIFAFVFVSWRWKK
jgi:hypothetical protein